MNNTMTNLSDNIGLDPQQILAVVGFRTREPEYQLLHNHLTTAHVFMTRLFELETVFVYNPVMELGILCEFQIWTADGQKISDDADTTELILPIMNVLNLAPGMDLYEAVYHRLMSRLLPSDWTGAAVMPIHELKRIWVERIDVTCQYKIGSFAAHLAANIAEWHERVLQSMTPPRPQGLEFSPSPSSHTLSRHTIPSDDGSSIDEDDRMDGENVWGPFGAVGSSNNAPLAGGEQAIVTTNVEEVLTRIEGAVMDSVETLASVEENAAARGIDAAADLGWFVAARARHMEHMLSSLALLRRLSALQVRVMERLKATGAMLEAEIAVLHNNAEGSAIQQVGENVVEPALASFIQHPVGEEAPAGN